MNLPELEDEIAKILREEMIKEFEIEGIPFIDDKTIMAAMLKIKEESL